MSTNTLGDEIRAYNQLLDRRLRRQVGIRLRTYKVLKALVQLVGAAAGVYAMWLGADPMTAFALITALILGPEAFEQVLAGNS